MSSGFEKLKLLFFETILSLIGFSTALLMFDSLEKRTWPTLTHSRQHLPYAPCYS
jgi:hypothetical protein